MTRPRLILAIRYALLVCLAALIWPEALYALPLIPLALFMPVFTSGCTIYSDDFATDKTGTDYTTAAGSFTVSGGTLGTSSSPALIVTNSTTGSSATGARASCTMHFASTSDKGRLVLAYVDDNTYWYVEVQAGASNGTMKVFEVSGGTPTQRGSTITLSGLTTSQTATVCFSIGAGLAAAVTTVLTNTFGINVSASPTIASTKAGLGAAASSSVTFDNFGLFVHRADNQSCNTCIVCGNCSGQVPDEIQVDVAGFGASPSGCTGCSTYDGTYITQVYSGTCTATTCCWSGVQSCNVVCFGFSQSSVEMVVTLTLSAGHYYTTMNSSASRYDHGTTKPDCMSYSGLVITGAAGGSVCSDTGVTYTLTTI